MIRDLLLENLWSAVKVTAKFNKKFSTSISSETVWRVLGTAVLNGRFARWKVSVSSKNRKIKILFE